MAVRGVIICEVFARSAQDPVARRFPSTLADTLSELFQRDRRSRISLIGRPTLFKNLYDLWIGCLPGRAVDVIAKFRKQLSLLVYRKSCNPKGGRAAIMESILAGEILHSNLFNSHS